MLSGVIIVTLSYNDQWDKLTPVLMLLLNLFVLLGILLSISRVNQTSKELSGILYMKHTELSEKTFMESYSLIEYFESYLRHNPAEIAPFGIVFTKKLILGVFFVVFNFMISVDLSKLSGMALVMS